MEKSLNPVNILKEVSFLYELSLSIGKTLDLEDNCESFIRTLMRSKKFDICSIWINSMHLRPLSHNLQDTALLSFAHPQFKITEHLMPTTSFIFQLINEKGFIYINFPNESFDFLLDNQEITTGALAIFKLRDVGYLKIYSNNTNNFDNITLSQLTNVVDKFAISVEGCLANKRNIIEIEQRKRTEQALETSKQRYQNVMNTIKEVIFQTDREGRITLLNKAWIDLTDFNLSSSLYTNLIDYIFISDREKCNNLFQQLLNRKVVTCNHELRYTTKSGKHRWAELFARLSFNDEGKITGITGTLNDINDRKQAEEALIKAKNIAESAKKAEEEFLAIMSHEIRTPLNAIVGMSNLLLNIPNLKGDPLEYASSIKQSADNLVNLINNILDYSKIKANRIDFDSVVFNIDKVIKNVLKTVKFKVTEKPVSLNTLYSADIPDFVLGDATRLTQILLNLVSNALKFTEKGLVTIKVSVKNKYEDAIEILFEVSDTGIGIRKDRLQKIFERYSQAETSTTRKYGGTGLGLSIVKELIERQNGKIWVKSKINHGSTFYFSLPFLYPTHEVIPTQEIAYRPKSLKNIHLLLVEDNLINQRVATKIFEMWDAQITLANNGKEAIDQLNKADFDLILLDLQMPVMDGYSTAKYIRQQKNKNYQNIPIIGLSASVYEDRETLTATGFNEYLTKPFDTDQLYHIILKYVDIPISHNPNFDEQADSDTLAIGSYSSKEPVLDNNASTEIMSSNPIGIIDLSFIRKVSNSDHFVIEMIDIFREQNNELILNLPLLLQQKSSNKMQLLLHKFKSSARNMGCTQIHDICNNMENVLLKTPPIDWQSINNYITQLLPQCEQAKLELTVERNSIAQQ